MCYCTIHVYGDWGVSVGNWKLLQGHVANLLTCAVVSLGLQATTVTYNAALVERSGVAHFLAEVWVK